MTMSDNFEKQTFNLSMLMWPCFWEHSDGTRVFPIHLLLFFIACFWYLSVFSSFEVYPPKNPQEEKSMYDTLSAVCFAVTCYDAVVEIML